MMNVGRVTVDENCVEENLKMTVYVFIEKSQL